MFIIVILKKIIYIYIIKIFFNDLLILRKYKNKNWIFFFIFLNMCLLMYIYLLLNILKIGIFELVCVAYTTALSHRVFLLV